MTDRTEKSDWSAGFGEKRLEFQSWSNQTWQIPVIELAAEWAGWQGLVKLETVRTVFECPDFPVLEPQQIRGAFGYLKAKSAGKAGGEV